MNKLIPAVLFLFTSVASASTIPTDTYAAFALAGDASNVVVPLDVEVTQPNSFQVSGTLTNFEHSFYSDYCVGFTDGFGTTLASVCFRPDLMNPGDTVESFDLDLDLSGAVLGTVVEVEFYDVFDDVDDGADGLVEITSFSLTAEPIPGCPGLDPLGCDVLAYATDELPQIDSGPARLSTENVYDALESATSLVTADGTCTVADAWAGNYTRGDFTGTTENDRAIAGEYVNRSVLGGVGSESLGFGYSKYTNQGKIVSDVQGSGVFAGRWIRTAGRNGVFMGTELTGCDGVGLFSDWIGGGLIDL